MIALRPYHRGDAFLVAPRAEQEAELASWTRTLDQGDFARCAWTLVRADDESATVLACGGWSFLWEGVALAWLVLGRDADGADLRRIARLARAKLAECSARRLETTVRVDFPIGVRFLEWLGFEVEGVLRAFGPDGASHLMMARVREGGA
jgi:RimJ/RimL family protein N-acetyltransferase